MDLDITDVLDGVLARSGLNQGDWAWETGRGVWEPGWEVGEIGCGDGVKRGVVAVVVIEGRLGMRMRDKQ